MLRKGQSPSPIFNNCSGKHLGLISGCVALGETPKEYHRIEHPAQVRLRKILSELGKVHIERMPVGSDGCAIPTHAMPLQNIAVAMSSFFSQKEISAVRRQALQRILHAWRHHPTYVSGTTDFASALSEKTKGRALLKGGAEGIYCGVLPEKGYAFALKVADGHKRAAEVVAAALFKQYSALTDSEYQDLKQWTQPSIKNTRGEPAGLIKISGNLN
jgi:L-asparaginase II